MSQQHRHHFDWLARLRPETSLALLSFLIASYGYNQTVRLTVPFVDLML
jgi:hypothetical protein